MQNIDGEQFSIGDMVLVGSSAGSLLGIVVDGNKFKKIYMQGIRPRPSLQRSETKFDPKTGEYHDVLEYRSRHIQAKIIHYNSVSLPPNEVMDVFNNCRANLPV